MVEDTVVGACIQRCRAAIIGPFDLFSCSRVFGISFLVGFFVEAVPYGLLYGLHVNCGHVNWY